MLERHLIVRLIAPLGCETRWNEGKSASLSRVLLLVCLGRCQFLPSLEVI
jgi:hypothetical protein